MTAFGNEDATKLVQHEAGFSYELMFSVDDNTPTMQGVILSIRAAAYKRPEITDLKATLVWRDESGAEIRAPFAYMWIFHDGEDSPQFARSDETDDLGLDLNALAPPVPTELKRFEPEEQRSYHIYFTGPDPERRCIPRSVKNMLVEIQMKIVVDGETAIVSEKIPLTPEKREFTEPYNLKSKAWNTHECD